MMTYATLQSDRREFLALTGLTLQEFQLLLNAFTPAYERRYPKDRTLADRPRQRCAGGGRKGVLDCPEQKLLFLLVYLKTYPLQVLMGELFGLSQPGVNYWIHRLLPVLRDALDSLSVLPERNPNDFARSQTATGTSLGSSSTAPNGVDRGRKALKNRPSTTVGEKCTPIRTSSSWTCEGNASGRAGLMSARRMTRRSPIAKAFPSAEG